MDKFKKNLSDTYCRYVKKAANNTDSFGAFMDMTVATALLEVLKAIEDDTT